jgi:ATP synthase subunit 6
MITNLFSIFDPSVLSFELYWVSLILPVFLIFLFSFNLGSMKNLLQHSFGFLTSEIFQLSSGKQLTFSLFFSLFFIILFLNFRSLMSFIYSPTSQISVIVPISLMFWGTPFLFRWFARTSGAIKSLLPQGTPYVLVPFIILIEIVRVTIRPVTLSVRLTANITAGHLLLSILINYYIEINSLFITIPIFLMDLLEIAVSLIQSYVFFTLVLIYSSEV